MEQWLPLSPIQKYSSKFLSTITILWLSGCEELSFLSKGITIKLIDKEEKMSRGILYRNFHSNEGLKEYIRFLDSNREAIIR